MWKSWYDINDHWYSTMDNLHQQIGLSMYQQCGAFNTPDMLTVGQGGQTQGQYRAQMFLWSILGAPLLLGNDIRKMDNFTLTLLTAKEVLQIDQDPQCVEGSLVRVQHGHEVWMKPLSDGSFAAALLNTLHSPQNVSIILDKKRNGGDLWPAVVSKVLIRDIWNQQDLGTFIDSFSIEVQPEDAVILKITPI